MFDTLEPRQVHIRDIKGWLLESFDLFKRRPFLFISLSLTYYLLSFSTTYYGIGALGVLLSIILCQVVVIFMILYAEAADNSRNIKISTLYSVARNIMWSLIVLSILCAAILIVAAMAAYIIKHQVSSFNYKDVAELSILKWVFRGDLAFKMLCMGVIVSTLWFLLPLLALTEMRLGEAVALAKRAEDKNELVIFIASYLPFLVVIVASLLSEWALLASLFLLPLFSTYQYVSYRHVFLGRKQNNPESVPERQGVVAIASS